MQDQEQKSALGIEGVMFPRADIQDIPLLCIWVLCNKREKKKNPKQAKLLHIKEIEVN